MRIGIGLLFLVCGILFLNGCTASKVKPLTSYTVQIHADDTINPSDNAPANPVVIRFYQLTDPSLFTAVEGPELFTDDHRTLTKSLVRKQVLAPLLPGENREVEVLIHDGAKFFAVLAEFWAYQQGRYRSILPLVQTGNSASSSDTILVSVSGTNIAVFKPEPKKPWWKFWG